MRFNIRIEIFSGFVKSEGFLRPSACTFSGVGWANTMRYAYWPWTPRPLWLGPVGASVASAAAAAGAHCATTTFRVLPAAATPTTLSRATLPTRTRFFLRNCSFPMGKPYIMAGFLFGFLYRFKRKKDFLFWKGTRTQTRTRSKIMILQWENHTFRGLGGFLCACNSVIHRGG